MTPRLRFVPARLAAALLTLGSFGCSDLQEVDEGGLSLLPQGVEFRDGLLDQVCPDDRFVVIVDDPEVCPALAGWTTHSIFEEGSPLLAVDPGSEFSDEQGHPCVYEHDPNTLLDVAMNNLNAAVVSNVVQGYAPDCEVVRAQGTSVFTDIISPMMRDIFHEQIDAVSATELTSTNGSTENLRDPVMVAVIDTVPPGVTDPRSEHGASMAGVVEDIACPAGPPCAVTVQSVLGLPRYMGGRDEDRGGWAGTYEDLTAGIYEAVVRWRAAEASQPGMRLVLNLSVGWEGGLFHDPGATPEPANVRAVRVALEVAACEGAFIVASAGNANDNCQSGALFPAAYFEWPAPDQARCAELDITDGPQLPARPLVYAVGGLDVRRDASMPGVMPGSRGGSMPPLAATSTHAVASDGTAFTAEMTGTSIASAAMAGAAALVWSYRSSLDVDELAAHMHAGGVDMGYDAQIQPPGMSGVDVHALSVCGALQDACAGQACGTLPLDCQAVMPTADLAAVLAELQDPTNYVGVPKTKPVPPNPWQTATCNTGCSPGVRTGKGVSPSQACYLVEYPPENYFISPQPDVPGCPNCTLTGDKVWGSLDSSYDGLDIARVAISIVDHDGNEQTYTWVGEDEVPHMESNTITIFELPQYHDLEDVEVATIAIQFDAEYDYPVENKLLLLD